MPMIAFSLRLITVAAVVLCLAGCGRTRAFRLARASIQLEHWRTMDRWQSGRNGFRFRPGPDILPSLQGSNPQPTWLGCPNCSLRKVAPYRPPPVSNRSWRKERHKMDRRAFLAIAASTAALPRIAGAQNNPGTVKIGWLTAQQEASLTPYLAAMRQGFSELGYTEGRNLIIDYRFRNDQLDRVPELATELINSGAELIVAQGAAVSEIAKRPLPVPLVYIFSGDPVAAGFADSLSRPRGNMTGVTLMAAELNSKRLEILRDIVPGLRRVAIIANPEHDGVNLERANSEE